MSAQSIIDRGMQVEEKKEGATKSLADHTGLHDPSAKKFHYVTTDFAEAVKYAQIFRESTTGADIVVLLCPDEVMQKDPQSASPSCHKIQIVHSRKIIVLGSVRQGMRSWRKLKEKMKDELKISEEYFNNKCIGTLEKLKKLDLLKCAKKSMVQEAKDFQEKILSATKSITQNLLPGESIELSTEQMEAMGLL